MNEEENENPTEDEIYEQEAFDEESERIWQDGMENDWEATPRLHNHGYVC